MIVDGRRQTLGRVADALVAAIAVSLPWSTSVTSILIVLWLVALALTLQWPDLRHELATLAGGLPVLLWLMMLVGNLWSDASFWQRLDSLSDYHKLLAIPLLMMQFRRSPHAQRIIIGFLLASVVLLLVSWLPTIFPNLAGLAWRKWPGVPVKDYLTQSGIFQLCAFGLAYGAITAWRHGHPVQASLCGILTLLFVVNIVYLASGRTSLVLMPIFVLLLGFQLFGWRGVVVAFVAGMLLAGIVWSSSNYMRNRLISLITEAQQDPRNVELTSAGLRLEFYRKSLGLVAQAPILGHGTGTIQTRFETLSVGQTGAAGLPTANPHQQTLAIAIQLGITGTAVLWTMWIAHLLLFRGAGAIAWFGLVIVSQNILSSLFNSHLSDFTQGWIYVFGVGVLGGTLLRRRSVRPSSVAFADQQRHLVL